MSESNGNSVFVEMLRGRDGLAGRDGLPGKAGEQGPAGPPGPCSGRGIYTRWFLPTSRGHMSYSTLALLGEAGMTTGEVQQITYVCPWIQNVINSTLTYRAGVQGVSYVYGAEY